MDSWISLYEGRFNAFQKLAGNLIARFIHYISFASASKVKDQQHHSSRMQSVKQHAEYQQATTAPDG
jgi:hypothetical protein